VTIGRPLKSTAVEDEQLNRIRRNVAALGLSQNDFAKLTGFAQPTISQWFSGKLRLNVDTAEQLESTLLGYVEHTETTVQLVRIDLERTTARAVLSVLKPVAWESGLDDSAEGDK